MAKVRFEITVKRGNRRLATIRTTPEDFVDPTIADIQQIIPTEQLLERLTNLRWHIQVVEEQKD